jgi:benzoate membrane transport protein
MPQKSILQPLLMGLITALVGFSSSFAVVLRGLSAAGATQAEAASGLMAAAIGMGLAGVALSVSLKQPVSAAWSTPGAALMAATGPVAGGWPGAVGAFLLAAALLILAALVKPFGRAVGRIPGTLASAMLAGVLFGLCLAPVRSFSVAPVDTAIVVAVWLLASRWRRLYATPAAALAAAVIVAFHAPTLDTSSVAPAPVWVWPQASLAAFIGLGLPLFIVTMASQNLPGIAVLKTYGYTPPPSTLIGVTGLFGALAAPFGCHALNLSAITAAMCASPDADPDPNKRWIASATCGAVYVALGAGAGVATRLAATAPILIEAVAGLALLGALGGSLAAALAEPQEREAAVVTFVVAASGTSFYGVGGAFWGLLAGGLMLAINRAGVWPLRPKPTA